MKTQGQTKSWNTTNKKLEYHRVVYKFMWPTESIAFFLVQRKYLCRWSRRCQVTSIPKPFGFLRDLNLNQGKDIFWWKSIYRIRSNTSAGRVKMKKRGGGGGGASKGMFWMTFFKNKVPPSPPSPPLVSFRVPWLGEESDASFDSDDYEDCNSPGH